MQTEVVHMYRHDENTERHAHERAHWPHSVSVHILTPIIVTNQIKKCIQFYLHYRMLHMQYTQEQTKLTHDYA